MKDWVLRPRWAQQNCWLIRLSVVAPLFRSSLTCPHAAHGSICMREIIQVAVNGMEVAVQSGTTVAAAVLQCGVSSFRRSVDRKSTRLNSSHVAISYAVFCLKKKTYR